MDIKKNFYTSVTKEEFYNFIENYPYKLIYDCYGACEPPLITYNDFRLGKWPDSIIARTYLYDNNKNDIFYEPEDKRKYFILKNYKDYLFFKEENDNLEENNSKESKGHLTIKSIKDCSLYINGEKIAVSPFTLECDVNFNDIKGGTGSPVII